MAIRLGGDYGKKYFLNSITYQYAKFLSDDLNPLFTLFYRNGDCGYTLKFISVDSSLDQ